MAEARHIPQTVRLVWAATRKWTAWWLLLLAMQGVLPAAAIFLTKGVVDASSKTPGVTLLNTNANGDANTQSTMVVDLINQGVDVITRAESE